MVILQVLAALLLLDTGTLCTWVDDGCSTNASQASRESNIPGASFLQISRAKPRKSTEHWQFDHEGTKWQGYWESFTCDGQACWNPFPSSVSRSSGTTHIQKSSSQVKRPITFITVHDPFFATNLGTSPLWLNRAKFLHEWIIMDNREAKYNISDLYARCHDVGQHDLLVYLHPDVILPEEWYDGFMDKLDAIEAKDPNWGVLGTAGVPLDWSAQLEGSHPKIASSITDSMETFNTGVDSLPVQSLDESLLVLRRSASLSFDRELPGFDLYGMDIVMAARKAGMVSYLLNIPVKHKTVNYDGQPYKASAFFKKITSASYRLRLSTSMVYFENKWCGSGFLPVWGTTYEAHQRDGTCPELISKIPAATVPEATANEFARAIDCTPSGCSSLRLTTSTQ